MSDDSRLDFILDLDDSAFASKVMGAIDNVEQLGATLAAVGTIAGVLTAAFLAVKTSLDMTFEAETIKSINAQFDILARQAGVVPEELAAGLEKASDGLIQHTKLLQLANDAMIRFGSSAGRLPEVMDLARKASVVTGRDIADVFQQLTTAIISGQTKQLKSIGIYVDVTKAVRDFAAAHNVAVNTLSDAGRRQAILNAALEDGQKRLSGTDTSLKQTTENWARMKNAVSDLWETVELGFNRVFGPTISKMISGFAGFADMLKKVGINVFGDETEKAKLHAEALTGSIKTAQTYLELFQQKLSQTKDPAEIKRITAEIELQKQKIAEATAQLEKYRGVAAQPVATPKSSGPDDFTDPEKRKKNEVEFNKEINALSQQRLQNEMATAQSIEQVEKQMAEQKMQIAAQADQKIAAVRNNENLKPNQKAQEIVLIQQDSAAKQLKIEEDLEKRKIEALDRYAKHAQSTSDGMARGFQAGSQKAQLAQRDFGAVGSRVFTSFENNSVSALQAWGAGQKSASDAAKGFIMGMLADEAEARGKLMLLASIWPPNPAGLAAGAGLIALSGFLRSQAGGGGSSGGGGGAGSASSGSSVGSGASTSNGSVGVAQNAPTKAVTINVQGHYFDTAQTRQQLVQMIQQEADASDFKVIS